jgi:hypothetical protein
VQGLFQKQDRNRTLGGDKDNDARLGRFAQARESFVFETTHFAILFQVRHL